MNGQMIPSYALVYSCLLKAKSLQDVRNTEGILQRGDGTDRSVVEELVDGRDTKALLEHGDCLADGLDRAGRGTLVNEAEEELSEGDTKGILELGHVS